MTETAPQYGTGPLRPLEPEYFFIQRDGKCLRLRIPGLWCKAIIAIIESGQGEPAHEISWGYVPGPAQVRWISAGATAYILRLAESEGWIE